MKHIFLDTNAIIDLLADRKPFSTAVAQLMNSAIEEKLKIYVSSLSYSNIYYILRRSIAHKEVVRLLRDFFDMTEVVEVSKTTISDALESSFNDLEDAIQYHCATSIPAIEMIVSRDSKGFPKSILPVMTAHEALFILQDK